MFLHRIFSQLAAPLLIIWYTSMNYTACTSVCEMGDFRLCCIPAKVHVLAGL